MQPEFNSLQVPSSLVMKERSDDDDFIPFFRGFCGFFLVSLRKNCPQIIIIQDEYRENTERIQREGREETNRKRHMD